MLLKRGGPFKPICFFASLDDLGRVGDSALIEEGREHSTLHRLNVGHEVDAET